MLTTEEVTLIANYRLLSQIDKVFIQLCLSAKMRPDLIPIFSRLLNHNPHNTTNVVTSEGIQKPMLIRR